MKNLKNNLLRFALIAHCAICNGAFGSESNIDTIGGGESHRY